MVHIRNSFVFRNHACIVSELLSISLYDLVKKNNFTGFRPRLARSFAHSISVALNFLKRRHIIHGDLKPENILLKHPEKPGLKVIILFPVSIILYPGLKVIDFGSSCYEAQATAQCYIQSRFYRAPEIILGCHHGPEIDMWSLGCILGMGPYSAKNSEEKQVCSAEITEKIDVLSRKKWGKKEICNLFSGRNLN